MAEGTTSGKTCPKCGEPHPGVRVPKGFREFLLGGWTCSKCGAKVTARGKLRE